MDRLTPYPPLPKIATVQFSALVSLLVVVIGLSICLGPEGANVSSQNMLGSLGHHLFGLPGPNDASFNIADEIIWQIRLPRTLLSALVGVLLALAGVALQGILMNPLADPYTVGVSAGAAVGAAAADLTGIAGLLGGLCGIGIAFTGGLLAASFVYRLASFRGRASSTTIILAGVVVSSMLWSLIPLFLSLANRSNDMSRLMFYLIGSVQSADWTKIALIAPFAGLAWFAIANYAGDLNVLGFGEESAAHLGVDVDRLRKKVMMVSALATGAAVATAGIIGFVGLIVPHIVRKFTGPIHQRLTTPAALVGATLMVSADTVARVWLHELPVGVVTTLLGAPLFCYIIVQNRNTGIN